MINIIVIWLTVQLLTYVLVNNLKINNLKINKKIILGHSFYRSIMCLIFFSYGTYISLLLFESGNMKLMLSDQIYLLNLSKWYMIYDLIFMFYQKFIDDYIRIDLVVHHILALICIYVVKMYSNYSFWTLISVSELLSVWSGLGIYASFTKNKELSKLIYVTRATILIFARIPWWLILICTTTSMPDHILILYFIGLLLIICLDLYWLSECLKKII